VSAPRQPRIKVQSVIKRYETPAGGPDAVLALDRVSFEVGEHEVLCLLGPSGCGKSTILNIIAGFETPSGGETYLDGNPTVGPGPDRAVVFQSPALFPWLTAAENVAFPLKYGPGARRAVIAQRTTEYIDAVGLRGFERHYPYQLSGGMRQRVALARALIGDPAVLLLDEPFGALDAQTRLSMHELLQSIWQQYRPTVLFITHDVEEAIFLADRILVMTPRPGRIAAEFNVPIARPRSFEVLTSPGFVELKKRILALVHSESAGNS
jgi:NitT/TauT family transport system ATP-binding protein